MSDDRIAEIRARHEDNASIGSIIHGPDRPPTWTLVGWKAHHDRAFLLLELDRVSAEIERLREAIRTIRARCVELDDSDAVSETLDIATAVLEDEP